MYQFVVLYNILFLYIEIDVWELPCTRGNNNKYLIVLLSESDVACRP